MAGGLLALDLASQTGWATVEPPFPRPVLPIERNPYKLRSGTISIGRSDWSQASRFVFFEKWLVDMLTVHGPKYVVFEAPLITDKTAFQTARFLMGLATITELVTARRSIFNCYEANNSTVKKHFLGFGGHSKEMKRAVVQKCRDVGWPVDDHNEADAIALLDFALSRMS